MIKTKIIEALDQGITVFDPEGDQVIYADILCYRYIDKEFGIRLTEWPDEDRLNQFRFVGTAKKADGQRYNIERPRYTAEEIRAALPKNLNFSEKAIAQAVIEQVIANLEKLDHETQNS